VFSCVYRTHVLMLIDTTVHKVCEVYLHIKYEARVVAGLDIWI